MPTISADLPDDITSTQIDAALAALGLDPKTTATVSINRRNGEVKAVIESGWAEIHHGWFTSDQPPF